MDRLCLSRAEGGRKLTGEEHCVQIEVKGLRKYLQTSKENILAEVGKSDVLEYNRTSK